MTAFRRGYASGTMLTNLSVVRSVRIAGQRFALLSAFALAGSSCAQTTGHPALLPQVQKLQYGDGSIAVCSLAIKVAAGEDTLAIAELKSFLSGHCPAQTSATVPLTVSHDETGGEIPGADEHVSASSREAYSISIDHSGAHLHGRSNAGVFYAVQTLRQLVEGGLDSPKLPFVEIQDWPALAYRGFMMDMSHGGVPTVAEVKRQLDELARWKANQYYFYTETTVDLAGYPLLHQSSNWNAEEIATIVAYARERHIDVVPCVELYGHLHDVFRQERYSDMAALTHGGEANPASKDAQSMLEDWVRQYAAMFPSAWLHVGFDEPFELERAGSARAGGVAPDVLWLRHLQAMAGLASKLGKRPMFWADIDEGAYIFNKYPGLAEGLPKNAVAAPWFYDARSDYSNLLDLFAKNHVPIVVATGISDWDNIAPDFESTFINIDGFLDAGRKAGAIGMLNTQWSDSALALHREAMSAMAYGAVAAWQPQPVDRAQFFEEYARLKYPTASTGKMAKALKSLEQSQMLLREALGSETSFRMWDDPFHSTTLAQATKEVSRLRSARLAAEDAQKALLSLSSSAASDDIASLLLAARMLDYTGMKFLYATEIAANFSALHERPSSADIDYLLKRETSSRNHSRVGDLMDLAGELEQDYRAEWIKQYRPYRLSTAMARWQAEQEYWRHFQASVWTVTRDFKDGDARPTLEQVLAVR